MEIYLDNAATTRPLDEVIERGAFLARTAYGNPSSAHRRGLEAEKILDGARRTLLSALGGQAEQGEIIFTSGGTEANNLALFGALTPLLKRKPRLAVSKLEHPSVLNAARRLAEMGADVAYIGAARGGLLDLEELEASLRDETVKMVSCMLVNNETGAVQPVAEIQRLLAGRGVLLHVDAVQGFGKLPLAPLLSKIDFLSVSAHKIHGPKGVGALYKRKASRLAPVLSGGGQEGGLRSGTENTAGIGAFARAVELAVAGMDAETERIASYKKTLLDALARLAGIEVNGNPEVCAPHILNFSAKGLRAEVLLHALEDDGIYVSNGAACSSKRPARR
jgi:cysteine desulfurase